MFPEHLQVDGQQQGHHPIIPAAGSVILFSLYIVFLLLCVSVSYFLAFFNLTLALQ